MRTSRSLNLKSQKISYILRPGKDIRGILCVQENEIIKSSGERENVCAREKSGAEDDPNMYWDIVINQTENKIGHKSGNGLLSEELIRTCAGSSPVNAIFISRKPRNVFSCHQRNCPS